MTTVAQGLIRDQMKANIGAHLAEAREVLGFEQPEQRHRRLTGQAAELLRVGAPGRALEVLEEILSDYEKQAAVERSAEQLFAAVLPLLRDIMIQSRVGGEVRTAKLFECDNCGASEFLIYDVGGHPHLQCVKCDTTFCQGDCPGADRLHLARQ